MKKVDFYFDESGFNESDLSALCCVITDDVASLREGISQLKEDMCIQYLVRYCFNQTLQTFVTR